MRLGKGVVAARARDAAGSMVLRAARRMHGARVVALDHAPARGPVPRWGHGRPDHDRLGALIARHDARYRESIATIAGYTPDLAAIPARPAGPDEPYWLSEWLPGLDAAALYSFVRARAPRRYAEVGSGVSTLWARRAIRDGGLETEIVSIDPEPRRDIDRVCDRVVREPLERADLRVFDELGPGDVVFMDGSHRVFTGSDATVFFLDVLPRLEPGVLCGIHDVFLPADYLPDWSEWLFSEQYLLAAWLLGGGDGIEPELAAWHASTRAGLTGPLDELWRAPSLEGVERRGWAFWLTVAPQSRM